MDFAIDQSFYTRAKAMLDKIDQNQKLQQLASANGIDVKNSTQLNEATKNNIATSVIALMLAKQSNDPRYADLVRYGMDHRKTKIEIINDYKDQANQIISRAKKNDFSTLSGFAETHLADPAQDGEIIQEGLGKVIGGIVGGALLGAVIIGGVVIVAAGVLVASIIYLIIAAISFVVKAIYKLIRKLTVVTPDKILKRLEKLSPDERSKFSIKYVSYCKYPIGLPGMDMSDENLFPARTFGFEFLKEHVREYAELIDRTLNMNVPTMSEFDNNLAEWQTLEGKLKGFSSAMKQLKRNFHEGHELIGILDDIFVEDGESDSHVSSDLARDENFNKEISNRGRTAGYDGIKPACEETFDYDQTVEMLKTMKDADLINKIKKLDSSLKTGLKKLKELEKLAENKQKIADESRLDEYTMSYGDIKEKVGEIYHSASYRNRNNRIKKASKLVTENCYYATSDLMAFIDTVVKQGIKSAKSGNTSSSKSSDTSSTNNSGDVDNNITEVLDVDQVDDLGSEFDKTIETIDDFSKRYDENNPNADDET